MQAAVGVDSSIERQVYPLLTDLILNSVCQNGRAMCMCMCCCVPDRLAQETLM